MKNDLILFDFDFNNKCIESVFTSLYQEISNIVDKIVERQKDDCKDQASINNIDSLTNKQQIALSVVHPMLKGLYNYIDSNDTLVSCKSNKVSGIFGCTLTIIRDDVTYYLETELITAGGYNIQSLHYRYLIKTKLKAKNGNKYYNYYTKKQDIIDQITSNIIRINNYERIVNTLNQDVIDIESLKTNQEFAYRTRTIEDCFQYVEHLDGDLIENAKNLQLEINSRHRVWINELLNGGRDKGSIIWRLSNDAIRVIGSLRKENSKLENRLDKMIRSLD